MKQKVLDYLKSINNGETPTNIGLALGKNYNTASSSVNNSLKLLLNNGLISKEKINGKTLYKFIR